MRGCPNQGVLVMTREFGDLVHIHVAKRLGDWDNQTNTIWALNYVRIGLEFIYRWWWVGG